MILASVLDYCRTQKDADMRVQLAYAIGLGNTLGNKNTVWAGTLYQGKSDEYPGIILCSTVATDVETYNNNAKTSQIQRAAIQSVSPDENPDDYERRIFEVTSDDLTVGYPVIFSEYGSRIVGVDKTKQIALTPWERYLAQKLINPQEFSNVSEYNLFLAFWHDSNLNTGADMLKGVDWNVNTEEASNQNTGSDKQELDISKLTLTSGKVLPLYEGGSNNNNNNNQVSDSSRSEQDGTANKETRKGWGCRIS